MYFYAAHCLATPMVARVRACCKCLCKTFGKYPLLQPPGLRRVAEYKFCKWITFTQCPARCCIVCLYQYTYRTMQHYPSIPGTALHSVCIALVYLVCAAYRPCKVVLIRVAHRGATKLLYIPIKSVDGKQKTCERLTSQFIKLSINCSNRSTSYSPCTNTTI